VQPVEHTPGAGRAYICGKSGGTLQCVEPEFELLAVGEQHVGIVLVVAEQLVLGMLQVKVHAWIRWVVRKQLIGRDLAHVAR
jgi:hypothetical protein